MTCIKQFWNTVVVKQSNDVTRLQALVDRKKVVTTEAVIRDVLRLDDADGVDCLPNEEIFAELARMGYEKPSTKLTFYKAFFSSQWKFLIHTILQSMSAKRTSWNEFSSAMASSIICLSTGDLSTHTTKYTSPALTQKVFDNMRRVRKGFSGVETPLFEGMLVIGEPEEQDQSIPSPTLPTPPLQQPQDLSSTSQRIESSADTDMENASNQGRMIADFDRDTGVALMDDERTEKKAEDAQVAGDEQVKGMQAKIYQINMDHASKVLSMDPEEESTAKTLAKTKSKDKGKGIMVEEPKPMKKKQQVKMDEKYARKLHEELNKDIDWDVAIDHVKQKAKEEFVCAEIPGMSYDNIRPIFEAKFNSNIEFLLKSKEQIKEEENRALERINETPAQKAAKRRELNDEVEELKQHLEIVPDEDDDVYTEATPLARKVPVVDYQIIQLNNKPHYKIIRADGTHQLYPNNFSDDYLLTTLRAMFGRPDGQDQVWKSQRNVHGQEKVKRWKLLESYGVHIVSLTTTQLILKLKEDTYSQELSVAKQKLMLLDIAAKRRLLLLSQVNTVNDNCCY
nr:hypothetical protein [Tanacetum cinerariifolium]